MLTLVQTGLSGLQFSLTALLPVIKSELGLSVTRTVLLASAMNAGTLISAIPAGQITNRFGERRTLTAGSIIAGVSVLFAATLSDTRLMLLPLLLGGVGVVVSHPAGVRLIMRHFAQRERGGAIAIRQTAVPLGGAIVALALPSLASVVGWRGALTAMGLVALGLALVSWLALPAHGAGSGRAEADRGAFGRVARNRGVALGVAFSLLLNTAQVSVVTFLALYAHESLGHSVAAGAVLLALVQASGIAGRILWGMVSDRRHAGRRRPLLIWLGAGSALSVGAFGFVQTGAPLLLLAALAVFAGLTAVAWNGLAIALTTEAAGAADAATAMSFIVMVVALVNAAGPPLGGRIIDSSGSYRPLWFGEAALLLLSPLLALLARERATEPALLRVEEEGEGDDQVDGEQLRPLKPV